MPEDMSMGFSFDNAKQMKCLSCVNRVKEDTIVCPTILKRLAAYCDKHPDIETNQELFTAGLREAMTGCSKYDLGKLEDSSLASTFKLVNALSEIVRAPNKTQYIWDMQPGVCSNCGRRDWYVISQDSGITRVLKKLRCRECDHEWEEVFIFKEKRK